MEADRARIAIAREKNLEYIKRLDSASKRPAAATAPTAFPSKKAKRAAAVSVYVTGLVTYKGCQQLERICSEIGKVKHVKFYKDECGGLKGDALIHFAYSRTILQEALTRLDHYEILPDQVIRAQAASFKTPSAKRNVDFTVTSNRVKVYGILTCDDHSIATKAKEYGKVTDVLIEKEFIVIVYEKAEEAVACVHALNGSIWKGKALGAEFDFPEEDAKLAAFFSSLEEDANTLSTDR